MESKTPYNVLIVDDEESVCFTLNRYLNQVGYEVSLAADFTDAKKYLEEKRFDVAIVDRLLANGQSGLHILNEIYNLQPFCQRILISGFPSFKSAAQALSHEPFAYLAKPVRKTEIIRVVESAIKKNHGKREAAHRERLFYSLFNNTPNAVAIYDLSGKLKFINPMFTQLFGYKPSESLGHSVPIVPDSDRKLNETALALLVAGNIVRDRETARVTKSGRHIDVAVSLSLCRDEKGFPTEIMAIYRDISESKSLERQLIQARKMEAIGTLTGGIAHDFNNILQAISGYVQLVLMDKENNEPEYIHLREIEQTIKRGSDLTKQLLTFSRKVESDLTPTNLNHEIRQSLKIIQRTIPKMVQIELVLSEKRMTVNADPAQITQVLINLAVNAGHAMPKGGKLTIKTEPMTVTEAQARGMGISSGPYIRLTVKDTGLGMDKKTQEQIFEPFFTTKIPGAGTGLGLAMVYGIIKNHGGHIECISKPGAGTQFEIHIPLIYKDIVPKGAIPEVKADIPCGRETVLVVDDEPAIRHVSKQLLERFGYTALVAEDAESALHTYKSARQPIGLVILDLNMPGMGGHECLKRLLEINPAVKVMISSGYRPNGHKGNPVDDKVSGFIYKPYNFEELLIKIRKILDAPVPVSVHRSVSPGMRLSPQGKIPPSPDSLPGPLKMRHETQRSPGQLRSTETIDISHGTIVF